MLKRRQRNTAQKLIHCATKLCIISSVGDELCMHFFLKVFDTVRNKPFSVESSVNSLTHLPFSEEKKPWRGLIYTLR